MSQWDILHEDGAIDPLDDDHTGLAVVLDIAREFRVVGMSVKFVRRARKACDPLADGAGKA